jgi:RNA 3'-terminal phosphate cyclase (ATP)
MIEIDGSYGEGGGQILRTSLSLSAITSKTVRISNIRAGRKQPGLRPQHLTSVEASSKICNGKVEGCFIGSTEIVFKPNGIIPGTYKFDIGTAGSTSLVLQTLFWPLTIAERASSLVISGGTHVPWSPCYHYLAWHWLEFIERIGFNADLNLVLAGYYPKGGGTIRANIATGGSITGINLMTRGKLLQVKGLSAVSNLPRKIAERQRNRVVSRIGSSYPLNDIRIAEVPSKGKGTFLLLIADYSNSQACFFGLGKPGKLAEHVADEAIDQLERFVLTEGAVDRFLADQLLLPLSLAKSESRFSTSLITQHLVTNAFVIEKFIPVNIDIDGEVGTQGKIHIYHK